MDPRDTPESLYPFPDHIFIEERPVATQYSHAIFERGIIDRCLVIWVDASVDASADARPPTRRANRISASAVRYLDLSSQDWMEFVTLNTLQYGTKFSFEAEFIAVHEAFRIACKLTDDFDRLVILSDCQQVLRGIRSGWGYTSLSNRDLHSGLLSYANLLYDLGITVELRWVPAHSSIEGNEQVDQLAMRARRTTEHNLAREQPGLVLKNITLGSTSMDDEQWHKIMV